MKQREIFNDCLQKVKNNIVMIKSRQQKRVKFLSGRAFIARYPKKNKTKCKYKKNI